MTVLAAPSSIKCVKSLFLIRRLKVLTLSIPRSSFVNLDHKKGPRYFRECFPYLIVLKRGRVKSEFLKLYRFSLSPFRLKRSCKYFGSRLFLALNASLNHCARSRHESLERICLAEFCARVFLPLLCRKGKFSQNKHHSL